MRRRLLNVSTLLSLVVFVTALVLWVRSYVVVRPPDRIGLGASFLVSADGGVGWNAWSYESVAPPSGDWQFVGFGRYRATVGARTITEWRVPYWFVALAAAALPAWWLRRSLRRRVPERGFEVAPPPREAQR